MIGNDDYNSIEGIMLYSAILRQNISIASIHIYNLRKNIYFVYLYATSVMNLS